MCGMLLDQAIMHQNRAASDTAKVGAIFFFLWMSKLIQAFFVFVGAFEYIAWMSVGAFEYWY